MDVAALSYHPEIVAEVGEALHRMSATEIAAIRVPDGGDRLLVATDRGLVDVAIAFTARKLGGGLELPWPHYGFSLVRWPLVGVEVAGKTSRPAETDDGWTFRLSLPPGDVEIKAHERDQPWDEFLKAVLESTEG
jgi:hypothetical protein